MGRKTEILKIKGDWVEVASDCRSTVGKPPQKPAFRPDGDTERQTTTGRAC